MKVPAILSLAFFLGGCVSPGEWKPVSVEGQMRWRADSGHWRAEVDPSRGRLIYLGPQQGPNFLNAPFPSPDPLLFGGHRVWLGPQTEWKPFWPPPPNWETSPAHSVKLLRPNLLEVESLPGSGDTVAIRRTYSWKSDGKLECGVSWEERSAKGRQAIQIFQLANGAILEAHPKPTATAPKGFVRLPIGTRLTRETIFPWPKQADPSGNRVLLRRTADEEKLGFPTQTLSARWSEGELVSHPSHITGRVSGHPDDGYRSQIYLGGEDMPLLEMEQLSPRLLPKQPGGRVGFTVVLELRTN